MQPRIRAIWGVLFGFLGTTVFGTFPWAAQAGVGGQQEGPPPFRSSAQAAKQKAGSEMLVYIGTYTRDRTEGIFIFRMDPASGKLTPAGSVSGVENPSFLALHPNGKFLYSVAEVDEFESSKGGAVSAFAVDPTSGKLTFLNAKSSGGAGPCHLVVDNTGSNVLVANYGGGSVEVLPIRPDGHLKDPSAFKQHEGASVDPGRQKGPHAHSVNLDSANRFAFVADLGLDKILIYRFDPGSGKLQENDPAWAAVAPGSGPRHFAFHPGGRFAYVINEMASTVTAFQYDATRGALSEVQTLSTLPAGFQGENWTAEVQVSPNGRFLYGSNRGHDSIAVFQIDPETGRLEFVETESTSGKIPRNFGIDPTGNFLLAANQDSDNVVVFRIDRRSGRLEPTGNTVQVPMPVCVKFLAGQR